MTEEKRFVIAGEKPRAAFRELFGIDSLVAPKGTDSIVVSAEIPMWAGEPWPDDTKGLVSLIALPVIEQQEKK